MLVITIKNNGYSDVIKTLFHIGVLYSIIIKNMNDRSIKTCLIKGFTFAYKNIDLFLIGFILVILNIALTFQKSIPLRNVISILISLVEFGYSFSIPLFLNYRRQKKELNKNTLISTTWKNTKRLIGPSILLYVGLIGLLMIISIIFIVINKGQNQIGELTNLLFNSPVVPIVFSIITPISVFTSLFFSLDNDSFFTALSKGIWYSIKNPIMYTIFFAFIFIFSFSQRFIDITNPFVDGIYAGLNGYLIFILTNSALLYLQKNPLPNKSK